MEIDPKLLHPIDYRPMPLNHNFYDQYLQENKRNIIVPQNQDIQKNRQPSEICNVDATDIVKTIMKENSRYIDGAVMKKAAMNAVNINHNQFTDLTPISFDTSAFIRNIQAEKK